jgi:hypothetical protein
MANKLPFPQVLDVLTDLVDKRSTGTLFIHSDNNHVITLGLDHGKISALYYGPKRGRKAIAPISNVTSGSYRFEATGLIGTRQDLPPTPEILNLLREPQTLSVAAPTATTTAAAGSVSQEDKEKICQELKDLLATHLGPIAGIVFDGALNAAGDFCASPEGTREFIEKLAEDIDDSAEQAQFREQANAALSRMLADE